MKAVIKVAVCGILAIALHNQANAQAGQAITQDAIQLMNKNAIARQFLAEKLGLRAGSTAEAANLALKKLAPADQAAVLKAITAYQTKAVVGNRAADITSNMAAAKAAFTTSTGAAIETAAAAQGSATNSATAAAVKGMTCNLDEVSADVAQGTGFDKDVVAHLISAKIINLKSDGCGGDIREMQAKNRKNLIYAADFADRKGVASITDPAARDQVFGEGLAEAWKVNEGRSTLDLAGGVASVSSIRNDKKCAYFY